MLRELSRTNRMSTRVHSPFAHCAGSSVSPCGGRSGIGPEVAVVEVVVGDAVVDVATPVDPPLSSVSASPLEDTAASHPPSTTPHAKALKPRATAATDEPLAVR
jgi:hypothetical protein